MQFCNRDKQYLNLNLLALKKTVFHCDEPLLPPQQVFNSTTFLYINIIYYKILFHISFQISLKLYQCISGKHQYTVAICIFIFFKLHHCRGSTLVYTKAAICNAHKTCWRNAAITAGPPKSCRVNRPGLIQEGESTCAPDYQENTHKASTTSLTTAAPVCNPESPKVL